MICFENIEKILVFVGMGVSDVVYVSVYVMDCVYMVDYMCVRDEFFLLVSCLLSFIFLIVSGFIWFEFKVEVEVFVVVLE